MADNETDCYKWIKRSAISRGEGSGDIQANAEKDAATQAEMQASVDALKDYADFRCPRSCTEKYSTIDKLTITQPEVLKNRSKHVVNVHVHIHTPHYNFDLDFDRWEAAARCTWTYYVLCYNKDQGIARDQLPKLPSK